MGPTEILLGTVIDDLTAAQATSMVNCDSAARACARGQGREWVDGSPLIARFFGLSVRGENIAQGVRTEWAQKVGVASANIPDYGVYTYRRIVREIGRLDSTGATFTQQVNDIWGGGFLNYTVNGGVQATQLVAPSGVAPNLTGELGTKTTKIPITNSSGQQATLSRGLAFSPTKGFFYLSEGTEVFSLTPGGQTAFLGNLTFSSETIAVFDNGSTVLVYTSRNSSTSNFRRVSSFNVGGITLSTVIVPGFTLFGIEALEAHPQTGQLFAIVRVSGQSSHRLVTSDPTQCVQGGNCTATDIGDAGDQFSGLTFDDQGRLFGLKERFILSNPTTPGPANDMVNT